MSITFTNSTGEFNFLDLDEGLYTISISKDGYIPVSGNFTVEKDDTTEADFSIFSVIYGDGVTDYDGNFYQTVIIGNQEWMTENLKVTHYPDGTSIPHITDSIAWENLENNDIDDAYCFYDNNSSSEYGALYTYAAATNGDNSVTDVQGACPDGWHLPTDAEWIELIDFLGGESVAGGKMKEAGILLWRSPNTGATNESGFTALPCGGPDCSNGRFCCARGIGDWWTLSLFSGSIVECRGLRYDHAEINQYLSHKSQGLSVRCLRN